MDDVLQAQGWVESIEQGYAWVRTERESGCGSCQGQSTCGTSSLSKLFAMGASPLLRLPNELGAKQGDRVVLEMPGSSLIKQAFLAYGLPLVGLFVGALSVNVILTDAQDWQVASGALLAMVGAWLWVRLNHKPVQPVIKRIIRSKSE